MIYLIVSLILLTNYLAYKIGKDTTRRKIDFLIFDAGLFTAFHAYHFGLAEKPVIELKPKRGREGMLNLFKMTTYSLEEAAKLKREMLK